MRRSGPTTRLSPPLLLVLLVLLLISTCTSARRRLPESLRDRDLFCETCYSVTTEMYEIVKKTSEGSLEQRIDSALAQVCSPEQLGRYAYRADLLASSCSDLLVQFENDLGLGLMAAFQPGKKPRAAATVKDVCVTRMKACKKTSTIPSLRQTKDKSLAPKTSTTTTPSAEDRPCSPPGTASEKTADRDIQEAPAERLSRAPSVAADAGKDEL